MIFMEVIMQITRDRKITETLELVDENGKITDKIVVNISPMSMAQKLSKQRIALIAAQKEVKENPNEDALGKFGVAVVSFIEAVFGTEDTKKIIVFYDNDYIGMIKHIMPFVEMITDKVRKEAQKQRKEILSNYKPIKRR